MTQKTVKNDTIIAGMIVLIYKISCAKEKQSKKHQK
jgi:hypothetical protein